MDTARGPANVNGDLPGMATPGDRNLWDMGPTGYFVDAGADALRRDVQMKMNALNRPANALNRHQVRPTDYE